jgi:predicted O-methyltransferase YrrM
MEFTADWFTHNIKEWSSLLSHFKNEVCSILDIGCFEGRSTLWFLESIPKSMVTAVDIFKETEEYKKHGGYEHDYLSIFKGNIDAYKDRVDVCVGYSFYVLQDLIKDNRRYDIMLMDHTFP